MPRQLRDDLSWPFNELELYPNMTRAQWKDATSRMNPDRLLLKSRQHQAEITGHGPRDSGWSTEERGMELIANFRELDVMLPASFPDITTESLDTPLQALKICGLAAPSAQTEKIIYETIAPGEDAVGTAGMVNFLGESLLGDEISIDVPYSQHRWADFSDDEQVLSMAMQSARTMAQRYRARFGDKTIPAIYFNCAWGIGRTGTALAAYQLANDLIARKDDVDLISYIGTLLESKEEDPSTTLASITINEHDHDGNFIKTVECMTTPAVALAINKIRYCTDQPMVAVESEEQIKQLERFEARLCGIILGRLLLSDTKTAKSLDHGEFIERASEKETAQEVELEILSEHASQSQDSIETVPLRRTLSDSSGFDLEQEASQPSIKQTTPLYAQSQVQHEKQHQQDQQSIVQSIFAYAKGIFMQPTIMRLLFSYVENEDGIDKKIDEKNTKKPD